MSSTYYTFWGKAGSARADASTVGSASAGAPTSQSGTARWHLLPYHQLDVAAVADVLLERDGLLLPRLARLLRLPEETARQLVVALISLHDIGKYSERFQTTQQQIAQQIGAPTTDRPYTVRHDALGLKLWDEAVYPALWAEDWVGLQERCPSQIDGSDYFRALAKPVMGHHGTPPRPQQLAEAGAEAGDKSQAAARDFARDAFDLLTTSLSAGGWNLDTDGFRAHIEAAQQASWLLAGLAVAADWVGSDETHFDYHASPMPLQRYWGRHARPAAEEAVRATGLFGSAPSAQTGMEALFPSYTPTPMQAFASTATVQEGPQLFVLEDATGSGKTESATTLAHRQMHAGEARGVYYGLPTMATANAMYGRIAEDYPRLFATPEKASVVLAHSARDLSETFEQSVRMGPLSATRSSYDAEGEDETAEAQCAAWLADNRKKALLAQVGVGTVDQALLGALPSSHQSLRLLGLGRNVLVVDEVHAYDEYMQELLQTLLAFHAAQGGTAILLSATLPQQMRAKLAERFAEGARRGGFDIGPVELNSNAFPLATCVGAGTGGEGKGAREIPVNDVGYPEARLRDGYRRTVEVEPLRSAAAAADRLVETARRGQCACWVRNTVPDARDGWRQLQRRFRDDPDLRVDHVELFHARYAQADRDRIEQDVLRRFGKASGPTDRSGRVLVATQVIGNSLDVDFSDLVSDLAPVDLIIQRIGRAFRHSRNTSGARIDGPDQRGTPQVGLLSPPLPEDPGADWYAEVFPRAAYVYPDVARLWLTAAALEDAGQIDVPGDPTTPGGVRNIIERVYGPGVRASVPDALLEAAAAAREEQRTRRAIGSHNVLRFDSGYGSPESEGLWRREENAPTRLGEPTATIRLARCQSDGDLVPWASGDHPWRRSQLRVRAALVGQEAVRDGRQRRAAEAAKATMPDRGRWSVLVALRKGESDSGSPTGEGAPEEGAVWTGRARRADGTPVRVTYSATRGLSAAPLQS